MARDRRTAILRRIMPSGMSTAFLKRKKAMLTKMPEKVNPPHRAIGSSLNLSPAASRASLRFNSRASFKVTRRLSISSSYVGSWQLTPGTSSNQPIHPFSDSLNTAVKVSKRINLVLRFNIRDPFQEKILTIGWTWVEQSLQETRKIFRKESDAKLKD